MWVVFINPSTWVECDIGSIFHRTFTRLNSKFSFSFPVCLTKIKEITLPYYLLIAWERIIEFIPFPRVLVPCKNSASIVSWTRDVGLAMLTPYSNICGDYKMLNSQHLVIPTNIAWQKRESTSHYTKPDLVMRLQFWTSENSAEPFRCQNL